MTSAALKTLDTATLRIQAQQLSDSVRRDQSNLAKMRRELKRRRSARPAETAQEPPQPISTGIAYAIEEFISDRKHFVLDDLSRAVFARPANRLSSEQTIEIHTLLRRLGCVQDVRPDRGQRQEFFWRTPGARHV